MNDDYKSVLRLRKKHTGMALEGNAEDGEQLVRAQSLRNAFYAGLIVVLVFSVLWALASTAINRIWPWLTLVLGIFVGVAVRRAGKGIDWRFPVLASALAAAGAFIGNIVVAAAFTAKALETSTFTILRAVTAMTWPVFFAEFISPADVVYALFGAAIAAFYANRRLNRADFLALRKWEQRQE